ncbi:MAG: aldo/keto reductase [Anaerolineae bacterium]|nr:aldo/keto reductase [Anaerolineae bacterium]
MWSKRRQEAEQAKDKRVQLGPGGIYIPPLGVGTWAWGDRMLWGYGRGGFTDADLQEAFDVSMEAGVNFFDTAEVYGSGRSEQLLGRFIQSTDKLVITATKFMPYPWRLRGKSLLSALKDSLERLGVERVDLYQMHWPFPPIPIERWMEAMARAMEEDLIGDVGVSNYSQEQIKRAQTALSQFDIPLVSNQVDYSLLDRRVERSGLLKACDEMGVSVIAYSPLGQGLLTGKYGADAPPPGLRGVRTSRKQLDRLAGLLSLLQEIGIKHGGKTPAQVAINWTIQKGAIPIPGAKSGRQARENLGALGWQLDEEDILALDKAT